MTLSVTGASWLERILLRLGPDATPVAIDERLGDAGVAAAAAARVLDRYR